MRNNISDALRRGDSDEITRLLTEIGLPTTADSVGVGRIALACLMEAAFSMAREPQPILMSKGAQAIHSERETELEREIEVQATKFEKQLAECRKQAADRDKLALQVDQLQSRLTLLSNAADEAVHAMAGAVRNTLQAINGAPEGEIRF